MCDGKLPKNHFQFPEHKAETDRKTKLLQTQLQESETLATDYRKEMMRVRKEHAENLC